MGRRFRDRLESFLIYAGITIYGLIVIVPFLHTIARSFSPELPIIRNEVYLWPVRFSIDAYRRLLRGNYFWRAYRNSLIITVVGTTVQMFMTVITAYPLSRRYLPGRNFLMTLVLIVIIFPPSLVPFYLAVRGFGLIDSYWALILPYAFTSFNMIVLKSYFQALPVALEESAIIDGANDIQVLWRIMLPLAAPVIATLTLFYAVGNWNMFLPAIFFINDGNKQPLQVLLRDLIWSYQLMTETAPTEELEQMAGMEALKAASVLIAALPMLAAYPFLQRYFIKGVTLGAIKG
jgi:ABC-type glycerol-3-phosphate transport system permease component